MATQLAKAYVQIIPSASGIKGSITNVLSGESASAGSAAGSSIASKIKLAIAAAGIGTALKKAIFEGAELEQSIGGVKTLFQDASDQVIQYANEAYKTAGISANDYMKQSTSFAAALLNSLGGDSAAAAAAANQAIIDMADNSNKMGTSLESIQMAYQGFAKQNYTMLDNLKLGYGGTKTEMERLLADAQKITGIKYNIDNLSDVYSAIHVIQDELHVTGATASEAATTLSGSFASMKASYTDFLGKLTLGEDVKPALQALVETSGTFLFNNLIPAIGNIISSLPSAIKTFLLLAVPQFLDNGISIIDGIIDGMSSNIPAFILEAKELLINLNTTIINHLPDILKLGGKLIVELIKGIVASIPDVVSGVFELVQEMAKAFFSIDWKGVGDEIIAGIKIGISSAIGSLVRAAKDAASAAFNAAKSFLGIQSPSKLFENEIGRQIDLGLAKGITGNVGVVIDSARSLSAATTTDFSKASNSMASTGASLRSRATVLPSADYGDITDRIYAAQESIISAIRAIPQPVFRIGDRDIASANRRGGYFAGSPLIEGSTI